MYPKTVETEYICAFAYRVIIWKKSQLIVSNNFPCFRPGYDIRSGSLWYIPVFDDFYTICNCSCLYPDAGRWIGEAQNVQPVGEIVDIVEYAGEARPEFHIVFQYQSQWLASCGKQRQHAEMAGVTTHFTVREPRLSLCDFEFTLPPFWNVVASICRKALERQPQGPEAPFHSGEAFRVPVEIDYVDRNRHRDPSGIRAFLRATTSVINFS